MSINTCPLCNSSHDVCSVEDVIYSGTSTSRTQGVNVGMFGTDDFSQMYFTTTTVSRLAQLLSPPRIPFGLHWLPIFILSAMGFYTVKYALDAFAEQESSGAIGFLFLLILGFFFSIFTGTAVGTLSYLAVLAINVPERKRWKANCEVLLSSPYCQKDGVVFDAKGAVFSPASYVDVVFSK